MKKIELPQGWIELPFKEAITKISTNKIKVKQKEYLETGILPVIDQGQEFIGGYTNDKDKRIEVNEPLLVFGDHTRTVKLISFDFAPGADGVKVIRPTNAYLPKLFEYFVKNMASQMLSKGYARHFQFLEKGEIPLPPLPEQHRIVAKIEALFSELESGVASLKEAGAQLKRYRQSVLKAAFEGRLTETWRAEHADTLESAESLLERIRSEREAAYERKLAEWRESVAAWEANGKEGKKPAKPKKLKDLPPLTEEELDKLPKLPSHWLWCRPEDIVSPENHALGIGPFGSNLKVSDYKDHGIPLIFVRHITSKNFELDPKFISEEKYLELLPHSVKPNDLVITKMGEPPGDCTVYPATKDTAVLTADCLKFRVWDKYVDRYFYSYAINAQVTKRQLGAITKGVAQKKISVDRFKSVKLPLCSTEEQHQIVNEIESRLSQADAMEAAIDESLQKAEALRQSILKKAFQGRLVPQDPEDEPASELLKRIKKDCK